MAQVTDVPFESVPDDLKPLYRKFTRDYGDFTNQARVLAHSPDAFRHLYGLLDAWRDRGTVPRRLVEIAGLQEEPRSLVLGRRARAGQFLRHGGKRVAWVGRRRDDRHTRGATGQHVPAQDHDDETSS